MTVSSRGEEKWLYAVCKCEWVYVHCKYGMSLLVYGIVTRISDGEELDGEYWNYTVKIL